MKRVWLYVDEFGCAGEEPEDEYTHLESFFTEQLGKVKFKRNMLFTELRNGSPDLYVFDIGGLCYVDYSGRQRMDWCNEVLRQVADHPNTLFIPYSDMTRGYCRVAMEDLVPETLTAPNVFCPKSKWDDYETELKAKLAEWMAKP